MEYVNDLLKNNEKKQYKSERKLWDAARCFRVFLMPGMFSFRNHGDFHEDVINIIMKDLVSLLEPKYIEVWGKFLPRGGLSIDPYCNYGKPGTDWEKVAWNRMSNHDMFPEKVDNR